MLNKNISYWLAALHANVPPIKVSEIYQQGDMASFNSVYKNNQKAIEKDITWGMQTNCHIICFADESYPSQLKQIPDPPYVLYVEGNLALLNDVQLAIVGARNATTTGCEIAFEFAKSLSNLGYIITSGLARGIDAASHSGALAASGKTIAVFGTGIINLYPKCHQKLKRQILMQGGAVISEFTLHTPPYSYNFPRRNRIIAGLARGVVVVEAARKSGSLITARLANDFGREVFAVPGSILNLYSDGCHFLIQQGAKLVQNVDDICEELGDVQLPKRSKPEVVKESLTLLEKQALNHIGFEMTHIDVILLRSRLTANELSAILLSLELKNYIRSVPGGYIRV